MTSLPTPPPTPSTTRPLRVAVVGLGTISGIHLDAIADQQARGIAELVGVCDTDAGLAAHAGELLGVPSFTDRTALFDTGRPDVVHVCTPHDEHVPVALDALAAGVHVLTEKPLAATTEAAMRLVEAAEAALTRGLSVGVCLQNRYNPTVVALARELAAGHHGPITGARAQVWWSRGADYYAAAPWRGQWARAGGGVLINQAIHTLDLLVHLLGTPDRWTGHATRHVPLPEVEGGVEVEDTAELRLWHAAAPGTETRVSSALFATNAHWENSPIGLEVGTANGLLRITVGDLVHVRPDGSTSVLATDVAAGGPHAYWGVSHGLLIADFYAHVTGLGAESAGRADRAPDARFWIDPAAALVSQRIIRDVYAESGLTETSAR